MWSYAADDIDESDFNPSSYFSEEEPNSLKYKKHSSMTNVWSIIIFILNIWILFFAIFWFSVNTHPDGVQLFLAIIIEWILFFEVLSRLVLRIFFPDSYKNLNLLHVRKNDSFWIFTILLIASFPLVSLNIFVSGVDPVKSNSIISYLLILKILRCFEIQRSLTKLEETLFYKKFKTLLLIKCIMNFTYVLLITHVSTCSWLFVSQVSTVGIPIPTGNSNNPFNDNVPYFKRMGLEDAPLIQKYIDSAEWAVSTLTGCSFGDVTPRTVNEIFASLIVFLTGMILLAKVFTDFASLMYLLDIEKQHTKKKLNKALKLCKILDVPTSIKGKIKTFYSLNKEGFSQTQYLPAVRTLPKSLHIDIILWINREMINKVNLFNFGSPSFVISVAKYLSPKISMAGDFVIKVGEFAEEMFFIKYGEVEVLATDNKTRIAILREGAYFGEIGLLMTEKRTVSIRALTFCVFEVLGKDDFNHLMSMYPEQKEFLLKISKQRIKTSTPEDLNVKQLETFAIQRDTIDPPKEPDVMVAKKLTLCENQTKFSIRQLCMKLKEKSSKLIKYWVSDNQEMFQKKDDNCIIIPMSRFYLFWACVIGTAVFYNCSLVSYAIFFQAPTEGDRPGLWYTLDIISVVVYLLDIFVCMNTAIKARISYITNKNYIHRKYIHEHLAIDLVAFFPIDYIMLALGIPTIYISWVKVLRLIKLPRFISILFTIHKGYAKKNMFMLMILAVFYLLLNHLAACIMHAICQFNYMKEYYYLKTDLFSVVSKNNRVDSPLADQPAYVRYASFIYWAFSTSSSGAYGDISGVAPLEKAFQVSSMLLFRIYFAFIAAEAANIVISGYSSYAKKQEQKKIYEEWMKHANLPKPLLLRVRKFNNYIWSKHHGINKNKILDELPSTTRHEIMEFLLKDMLANTQVFPQEEVGLVADLIKHFRLVDVTKDEYIFKAGETAEGLFFILEGKVVVLSADEKTKITYLGKNQVFGESGLLKEKKNIRKKSAKAANDVSLAEISLENLKRIWEKYPIVKRNIISIERRRKRVKEPSVNNENNKENWILKEIDLNSPIARKETIRNSQTASPFSLHKAGQIVSIKNQKSIEMAQFQNNSFDINTESLGLSPHKGNLTSLSKSLTVGRQGSSLSSKSPSKLHKDTKKPGEDWELSAIPESPIHSATHSVTEDFKNIANDLEIQLDLGQDINKENTHNNYSQLEKNITEKDISKIKENQSLHMSHTLMKQRPKNFGGLIMWFLEFLKITYQDYRILILNLVLLWNLFFIPLNLGFTSVQYKGTSLAIEIIIILIFFLNFLFSLQEYISLSKNLYDQPKNEYQRKEKKYNRRTLFTLILDFLYIIPFGLIFEAADIPARRTNFLLIMIQLIRFSYLKRIMWIFHLECFKKRYALGSIMAILFTYVIMNHVFACLFIMMRYAKEDFNDTWLAKIPAPQFNYPNNVRVTLDVDDGTIYIHALYWSYVTTSHVGVGDVVGINVGEKFYSSFVIMVSTFLYAFLFGNLALMVDSMTPKFRRIFANNYRNVIEYVKISRLEGFTDKIHKYYSYIWMNNKGIDEDAILNNLPISIKYDVVFLRYNVPITNSRFFMNSKGQFDYSIFYSFCKKYKCAIFMENDYITAAGQQTNDVYFLLDGEAEIVRYSATKGETTKLYPGNYFGGVVPGIVQPQGIRATKITKVAILDENSFNQLKAAYPEWFNCLLKFERIHTILLKFINRLRNRIKNKKKKVIYLPDFGALSSSPMKQKQSLRKSLNLVGFLNTGKNKENGPHPRHSFEGQFRLNKLDQLLQAEDQAHAPVHLQAKAMKSDEEFASGELEGQPIAYPLAHSDKETMKNNTQLESHDLNLAEQIKPRVLSDKDRHVKFGNAAIGMLAKKAAYQRSYTTQVESKPAQENLDYSSKFALQRNSHPVRGAQKRGSFTTPFQKMFFSRPDEESSSAKLKSRNDDTKRLRWFIHPESNWKFFYEFVYTLVILYSIFAVPLYVGFGLQADAAFIAMEVFCLIVQAMYLFLQTRTPQYIYGKLTLDFKFTYLRLKENGLFLELFTLLPFNLIFGTIGVREPVYLIGLLRMNRVLLVQRLPSQFSVFESKWLKLTSYFKIIKPTFYLAFVWHFTSCLWGWFLSFDIEKQYDLTWYGVLDLTRASLWEKYIFSLLFTMNIATTAGYPEMIIYNNYERCLMIVYVYFGDAFFGLTFAWFAANSTTFPEKYDYVFKKIRQMDYIFQKGQIPLKLKNKLENYFAYIVETRNQNKSCLEALSGLLPLSTLKDLAYTQAQSLHSLPIFKEYEREKTFLNEIVQHLQPTIYLPDDYITSRNEFGAEMYIIAEGTVHMLSPNEKKTLCSLRAGSYFGELGLYTTTKRLTSFVASTFCLIYVFDREILRAVLSKYPHIEFEFKLFSNKRSNLCAIEGSSRKDRLQQAYARLRHAGKGRRNAMTQKEQTDELLKVSEIPKEMNKDDQSDEEEEKEDRHDEELIRLNIKNIDEIQTEDNKEGDSFASVSSTLEEYVDDEEIEYKDIDTKKNTFRIKTRVRERRYSRLNMGKEKSVSRSEGLTLRWGINMD